MSIKNCEFISSLKYFFVVFQAFMPGIYSSTRLFWRVTRRAPTAKRA
ncbi:MAG: hypothetical protein MUO42_03350 [Anaerolineaceae bacterium]|nr:hypothetical protein [Anaerolineaceae bacterium]